MHEDTQGMPEQLHIRVATMTPNGPDGLPVLMGYIANAPEPFDQVRFLWVTANDEVAFGLDSLETPSGTLPIRWDHGPQAGELVVERTEEGFAQYLAMVAGSDNALGTIASDIGQHLLTEVMEAMGAGGDPRWN